VNRSRPYIFTTAGTPADAAAALAALRVLASWLLHTMEPWSILGANLVAAVVMLGLLFLHHQCSLEEVMTSAE